MLHNNKSLIKFCIPFWALLALIIQKPVKPTSKLLASYYKIAQIDQIEEMLHFL